MVGVSGLVECGLISVYVGGNDGRCMDRRNWLPNWYHCFCFIGLKD